MQEPLGVHSASGRNQYQVISVGGRQVQLTAGRRGCVERQSEGGSKTFLPPPPSESSRFVTRKLCLCTIVQGSRLLLKCDGTRWRTEGKWRGNWRMQCVASTLHTTSEHGVSSITTADAYTSAASSRLNWRPPADLNGLVRFAERRNLVSAPVPSYFNWPLQYSV